MKFRPKDNYFENKKYEEFIRTKACLTCGDTYSVLHHVLHARNNCYMGIPLCVYCHTFGPKAYHVIEHEAFEEVHKINLEWEIQKLLMEYIDKKEGT